MPRATAPRVKYTTDNSLECYEFSRHLSEEVSTIIIMEGVSAASSGIAIVSLAIQLIEITRDMRSFFDDITKAPDEIQRLTFELTQLTNILRDIHVVICIQQAQDGAPYPLSSLNCRFRETKANWLWQDVETLGIIQDSLQEGRGKARKAALSSNALSHYFDDYEFDGNKPCEYRSHIQYSESDQWPLIDFNYIGRYFSASFFSASGTIITSDAEEDPEFSPKDVFFTLVSQSLRMDPVADSSAPIFCLCKTGEIENVQLEFSSGNTSPFVIDQNGRTLLHYAAEGCRADLVQVLLNYGLDANRIEHSWNQTPLMFVPEYNISSTARFDTIRALIIHGHTDITILDRFGTNFLTKYMGDSEGYLWVINQEEFDIDLIQANDRWYHTIATGIGWLFAVHNGDMFIGPQKDYFSINWAPLIQRLLKLGLSPSPWVLEAGTPLDSLFSVIHHEVDSHILADTWLLNLSSAGVDIESYVRTEKLLHSSGFLISQAHTGNWTKEIQRRLVFERRENLDREIIRWEWFHDEEAPASIVLNEFRSLDIPRRFDFSTSWEDHWPFKCTESDLWGSFSITDSARLDKIYAKSRRRWASKTIRLYKAQLAQMGLIYSLAAFTIVAASGNDANAGLPGVRAGTRDINQNIVRVGEKILLEVVDGHGYLGDLKKSSWSIRP
ncbi:uncharacterized protein PAC_12897 [Phialocephala subalpina]|uniref:Uncharacterized protein n=1 Tax=Phialocephala subalpina TaxID=576137 RepID=A0A1L7XD78_9HELO|nr:uncharacterized protein PAC_12897 [Phialocephala subalpina]